MAAAIFLAGISMANAGEGVFRHVVCFKFKEGTSEAEIVEIEKAFAALKGKIDTITDFEWGRSDNIEPLNDEFTHCFSGDVQGQKRFGSVPTPSRSQGLREVASAQARQGFCFRLRGEIGENLVGPLRGDRSAYCNCTHLPPGDDSMRESETDETHLPEVDEYILRHAIMNHWSTSSFLPPGPIHGLKTPVIDPLAVF